MELLEGYKDNISYVNINLATKQITVYLLYKQTYVIDCTKPNWIDTHIEGLNTKIQTQQDVTAQKTKELEEYTNSDVFKGYQDQLKKLFTAYMTAMIEFRGYEKELQETLKIEIRLTHFLAESHPLTEELSSELGSIFGLEWNHLFKLQHVNIYENLKCQNNNKQITT